MKPLVVAIDGPAGAGKSTSARELARRLGVPYLDTGAMYRAIAVAVLDRGVDPQDRAAVEAIADVVRIDLAPDESGRFEVLLDGVPVEGRIRTAEVGKASSQVSAHSGVRTRMVELQRAAAERFGGVLEGRDIGTRVFPDAPFKFFLDADPAVRSERRQVQLASAGQTVQLDVISADLAERDHRDRTRADSPLAADDTYQHLDATELSADQVVERMLSVIRGENAR